MARRLSIFTAPENIKNEYHESLTQFFGSLENQFIYPGPKGSKLIFFAPLGVGVDEENQ